MNNSFCLIHVSDPERGLSGPCSGWKISWFYDFPQEHAENMHFLCSVCFRRVRVLIRSNGYSKQVEIRHDNNSDFVRCTIDSPSIDPKESTIARLPNITAVGNICANGAPLPNDADVFELHRSITECMIKELRPATDAREFVLYRQHYGSKIDSRPFVSARSRARTWEEYDFDLDRPNRLLPIGDCRLFRGWVEGVAHYSQNTLAIFGKPRGRERITCLFPLTEGRELEEAISQRRHRSGFDARYLNVIGEIQAAQDGLRINVHSSSQFYVGTDLYAP